MTLLPILVVLCSTVLHASWNLLAHSWRSDRTLFLRATFITAAAGAAPVLWAEFSGQPLLSTIWHLLVITGLCQGFYFLGLAQGYRSGDFSVVYPVARALPVLGLAVVDVARGRMPSPLGWLGIVLVTVGCLVLPLESLRLIRLSSYLNRTGFWVLVTALGTIGYTTVDKLALEAMPPGVGSAVRYGIWQAVATLPILGLIVKLSASPAGGEDVQSGWQRAATAAVFISGAYWLILWVYQISPYASYIVALRQFSIVLGVMAAALILREPAPGLRISPAMVIAVGILCVAYA